MRRILLLLSAISLTGCLIAARPAGSMNGPTPTTSTHEPTRAPPPTPLPPPPPPPAPRLMTCDDGTRMAMQYAADHQMGPMRLQNCHVEEDGRILRVFLKSEKGEKHGKKDHDKRQLKIKFDARDGRVLEAKDKDHDDDDDDEHGEHGKGHDKD